MQDKYKKGKDLDIGLLKYMLKGFYDYSLTPVFDLNMNLTWNDISEIEKHLKSIYENFKSKNKNHSEPIRYFEKDVAKYRFKSIPSIYEYISFFLFLKENKNKIFMPENAIANLIGDKINNTKMQYYNKSILFDYYGKYPLFTTGMRWNKSEHEEILENRRSYKERNEKEFKKQKNKNYTFTVDINDFYDSIYTHKIYNHELIPKINFSNDDQLTKFFDKKNEFKKLDIKIRQMNNRKTNGILIGNGASVLFSEILLNQISEIFIKKQLTFERFADQFTFYFENEKEKNRAISFIYLIFDNYNLRLKHKRFSSYSEIKSSEPEKKSKIKYLDEKELSNILKIMQNPLYKKKLQLILISVINKIESKEIKIKDNDVKKIVETLLEFVAEIPKLSKYILLLIEKIIDLYSVDNINYDNTFLSLLKNYLIENRETSALWLVYTYFYIYSKKNNQIDEWIINEIYSILDNVHSSNEKINYINMIQFYIMIKNSKNLSSDLLEKISNKFDNIIMKIKVNNWETYLFSYSYISMNKDKLSLLNVNLKFKEHIKELLNKNFYLVNEKLDFKIDIYDKHDIDIYF